jgi:hypothetical protein
VSKDCGSALNEKEVSTTSIKSKRVEELMVVPEANEDKNKNASKLKAKLILDQKDSLPASAIQSTM